MQDGITKVAMYHGPNPEGMNVADYLAAIAVIIDSIPLNQREDSVVVMSYLDGDWADAMGTLGTEGPQSIAWVNYHQPQTGETFYFGYVAWDDDLLRSFVSQFSEAIMGGVQTEDWQKMPQRVLN